MSDTYFESLNMVVSENSIAFAADDPQTPDATASDIAQRCPQVLTRDTPPQSLRPPPTVARNLCACRGGDQLQRRLNRSVMLQASMTSDACHDCTETLYSAIGLPSRPSNARSRCRSCTDSPGRPSMHSICDSQ